MASFYSPFFCGGVIIKELLINEEIRAKDVRLIDAEGNQIGVVPISRALEMASEKKLDLVNISPNANPPVCKILDYGKYRYDSLKKEKESKKKQRISREEDFDVDNLKVFKGTGNISRNDRKWRYI